jgi:hypothetical protein
MSIELYAATSSSQYSWCSPRPTNRSHQPFAVGVGLGRSHWSAQNLQPKCLQVFVNFLREDRVTIMDEKAIPIIAGNGFAELLQGPASNRMSPDIAVQNATAPHLHDHEHVQSPTRNPRTAASIDAPNTWGIQRLCCKIESAALGISRKVRKSSARADQQIFPPRTSSI